MSERWIKFESYNLIGDGLYISPAVNQWKKDHPEDHITIKTFPPSHYVSPLYRGMPGVDAVYSEGDYLPDIHFDFEHKFEVSQAAALCDQKKIHVAEAYAELLGVRLEPQPDNQHLKPLYNPPALEVSEDERDLILVSMFSMSCSSQEKGADGKLLGKAPNKMLPYWKWMPILEFLNRRFDEKKIKFLGAKEHRADDRLKISEDQYLTGVPLPKLARIMQYAKLLVSIDNGMGHLAASQDLCTFLLYPMILGTHFILPKGNRYLTYVHMNPVTVEPAQVVAAMRIAIPGVLSRKEKDVNQR